MASCHLGLKIESLASNFIFLVFRFPGHDGQEIARTWTANPRSKTQPPKKTKPSSPKKFPNIPVSPTAIKSE
jgi:hypothetical protein